LRLFAFGLPLEFRIIGGNNMNEGDTRQLNVLYAYIKNKRKRLNLSISCNVCKKKFNKSEFYTSTHVCRSCWIEYISMTRLEKKELQDEKVG